MSGPVGSPDVVVLVALALAVCVVAGVPAVRCVGPEVGASAVSGRSVGRGGQVAAGRADGVDVGRVPAQAEERGHPHDNDGDRRGRGQHQAAPPSDGPHPRADAGRLASSARPAVLAVSTVSGFAISPYTTTDL
jgi:hypothetical protein